MDLGSINEKLMGSMQRVQLEQIALITKTLGISSGSQFLAHAQNVSQATSTERAALLNSIEVSLAQLNKNSAAPATKALINQLIDQKNLLQTADIKLVNLNINPQLLRTSGTIPNSSLFNLLAYTHQPVQAGQALLLQFNEVSGLRILQSLTQAQLDSVVKLLTTNGLDLPRARANATPEMAKDIAKLIAKLDIHQWLQTGATDLKKPSSTEAARAAISQSFRNLLPQKDSGQDLVTNLPKLAQFIQQIPPAERKDWLSSQLQDALKTLANQIRTADQLTQPKLLAASLASNGQTFENKLAQIANAPITTPFITKSSLPAASQTPTSIAKAFAQDLKGALLGLSHQLLTELNKSPLSMGPDATRHSFTLALPQLLGLLNHRQQGELNPKQMRTQLIQLLHQYTLGSLAKIQLQQLHTLNHQLTQVDSAQPNQSWQFELPVRHGHEIHPLQIHMEQQWVEEKKDEDGQQNQRVRQWTVMLNFDLPIVGKFFAQFSLLNDNLSAKFWAERESTLSDAKQKLTTLTQHLESQGIKVTQTQFIPGLPPQPKMMLGYSLVDIKT